MNTITQCKTKSRYFESNADGKMVRVSKAQYVYNQNIAYRTDTHIDIGDRRFRSLHAPYPFAGHKS